MSEWAIKRFWKAAHVDSTPDGYAVLLDSRSVKTPAKAQLLLPTRALAEATAAEWDAQEGEIKPTEMPFTRMANAAIDKVRLQHQEVADMLAAYGDSDLLCYRADQPEGLIERQNAAWDPALEWAASHFGARLDAHTGVMHIAQDKDALARLHMVVSKLSDFELAAFHDLVSLTGSLVLGLGAAHDWRDSEEIWALSRVDETWQEELWGRDEEAAEITALKKRDFLHAKRFFTLSTTSD